MPRKANRVDARIVWHRLDAAGQEACRLRRGSRGWVLEGVAVFVHEAAPCRVDYRVRTTEHWRTRDAHLSGWIGNRSIDVGVEVDAGGDWVQNDVECRTVAGCVDVDLGFSPSTNTLAIQRLGLAVGQSASVRAAWLPFPLLELQVLEQRYTRVAENTYAYESGSFKAQLDVDQVGLVQTYSGLWQRSASSGGQTRHGGV